jgi:hypothetical protein
LPFVVWLHIPDPVHRHLYRKQADMKYIMIIAGNTDHSSDGVVAPDALAYMQRELPVWISDMDARGVRLFGRELDLPATAATVRVRDGEALVTDGPFAETKEFMAGFDLLECASLDEAVEAAAGNPIARFNRIEIRPFMDGLQVGEKALAFGRGEDGGSRPYALIMWMGGTPAAPVGDQALMDEGEAWKQDAEARGLQILGNALQGPQTARTISARDGEALISDGPFTETKEFIAGIDVVSCTSREQAIDLAVAHPIARYHAIEVRPFYVE